MIQDDIYTYKKLKGEITMNRAKIIIVLFLSVIFTGILPGTSLSNGKKRIPNSKMAAVSQNYSGIYFKRIFHDMCWWIQVYDETDTLIYEYLDLDQ